MKHFDYSCIGTESCYKQKTIPKYFVQVLKQISDNIQAEKDQKLLAADSSNFLAARRTNRDGYDELIL